MCLAVIRVYFTIRHCSDCRRACDTQAVARITVPVEHFVFIQNEPYSFNSSVNVVRTFCVVCGTSLTYKYKERDQETDITVGSLDYPERFPPTKNLFCRDRLAWLELSTKNIKM